MAVQTIDIKDKAGVTKCTIGINEGAKGYCTLMEEDYIKLPFTLATPITFTIGDYVDLRGVFDDALGGKLSKIYKVTSLQTPTYDTSTGGYKYELELNAYYYEWNLKLFKYLPEQHGQEASWSLTATLDVHMGVFLRNLKARNFKHSGVDYTFEIDDTVTKKALALTYSDCMLVDALTQMAEEADCEWWVTDNVIHFGKCESGDSVKMELNAEASNMIRSDSKGTYATRIYAFGAERNIPKNYRPVTEQTVVSGVVQKRLMLPEDTPYVDAYENMDEADVIEGVVTFDEVYPRRVGTMEDIQTVDRKLETDDDEEDTTYKAYQFKDSGITFSKDYLTDDDLMLVFQSGSLNGMSFGVTFNPNGKSPEEQLFEIVANEDYGRLLPDEVLCPKEGDKYVLYNFNIQMVSDQYIPAAEKELLEKAKEYVATTCIDDGTYSVTLASDWVYANQLDRTYDIGQKVKLVNPSMFDEPRESRVLGWEMYLDYPYDAPIYSVGESVQYSRLGDVETKVDAITYKGQTYVGNGSGVYVVRQHDATSPSDSNVFSAIRSLSTFLRKDKADSTNYLVSFLGGLLSDGIKSQSFTEGSFGSGFGAWMDTKGQSHIEVDNLLVRLKAEFGSLGIREITHIGGELILSSAAITCSKVETVEASQLYYSDGTEVVFSDGTKAVTPSVYRCYFTNDDKERAITNDFAIGDLATCRTWNIKEGTYENVTNRYYWRLVVGVGDDYIDLSSIDCDASEGQAGTPMAGDRIIQLGNKYNDARQSAVVLSTYGDDAPSVKLYRGIGSYSLTDKEFFDASRKQVTATVDKLLLKGKNNAYISVGEELDSRPTADDLLNVGINIGTRQVTVTSDKFLVRTPKGEEVAAFTTKDGKPILKAGLIDVDSLFAGTVNANNATITNFTFANAQSKDGSFSVDGNGVTKIGGFTVTSSSIGATSASDRLVLTKSGILFESGHKMAGIGDTLPPSSGVSDRIAAVFGVTLDTGNYHTLLAKNSDGSYSGTAAMCIEVSGGTYYSLYGTRQIGLSIVTQDTDKDTAIDFRGRLRSNGQFGMTTDNCVLGTGWTLIFENGILVGSKQTT
jgi:hypothetical protein